jgi:hypothetical protein
MNFDINNYGSLPEPGQSSPKVPSRQTFSIAEPSSPLRRGSSNSNAVSRYCGKSGDTDGFKVIVISMFVFAVAVTVALIITIASGKTRLSA